VQGGTAKPKKAARVGRTVLVLGLILVLLGGGTVLAARLLVNRWEDAFGTGVLLAPEARGPATTGSSSVEGPLTYLLIGSDQRAEDPAAGSRADAIIIMHASADLREAYLISIPRDLLAPIPGYGEDKINAAFQFGGGGDGGAQLVSATLTDLTGVSFDGAAIFDFGGFQKLVDAIGGVELCLEQQVDSQLPAGCQHLTGAMALNLARHRQDLPGGDFDRIRNQQRLILAMVDQAADTSLLTNPLRLDRTIRAAGNALTVDTGGVPLRDLASALRQLRGDRVIGITYPSYPGMIDDTSYMLADPAADGLYQALRDSTLAAWVTSDPRWRNN
jgi:LCP family protein required for cell wall assembly